MPWSGPGDRSVLRAFLERAAAVLRGPAAGLAVAMLPFAASAQSYRQFGDWIGACDNTGRCTALGLSAESDSNAFVRVTRTVGDRPSYRLTVAVATTNTAPSLRILMSLAGPNAPHTHVPVLGAVGDGEYARATMTGRSADALVAAFAQSRTLALRLSQPPAKPQTATVLLNGAPAALAIFAPGGVPRVQTPAPSIVAKHMANIPSRHRPLPPGVRPSSDPGCAAAGEIWIALSPSGIVRGLCTAAGAYNTDYRFYFADAHPVKPADFVVPFATPDAENDGGLVNPSLARDGMSINSYTKDVGYGGCGESSDWVWTGKRFALVRLSELHACRGVPDEDWPPVFVARPNGTAAP